MGVEMKESFLFSAKKTEKDEWIVGYLIGDVFSSNPGCVYIISEKGCYVVDHNTICQCIGARDRNGNLIFENDVVKHYNDREHPEYYTFGVITWDEHTFAYYRSSEYDLVAHLRDSLTYEVVGNTVDEPDLLDKIRQGKNSDGGKENGQNC